MPVTTLQVAAAAVAIIAVVCDVRTRRIPNVLTFSAAAAGVIANTWISGWSGLVMALGGCAAGIACFLPLFALRGMGAGDLKLLGALGAWIGPVAVLWVALFSSLAGGVMAVGVAVFSGYLTQAFVNIAWMFRFWRASGPKPVPEVTLDTHTGPRLPYAVPILAGLMGTIWLR